MSNYKSALSLHTLNQSEIDWACSIKIVQPILKNDFVYVTDKSAKPRIAKVIDINKELVTIKYYMLKHELPRQLEDLRTNENKTIEMSAQEVIEDGFSGLKTISKSSVCGHCKIVDASHTASVPAIIKEHMESNKNNEIYICRYKLVRQTTYVLVPVSFKAATSLNITRELRERNDNISHSTKFGENDEPSHDQHQLNSMETISLDSSNEENQMVSPIKISGQHVQRIARKPLASHVNAMGIRNKEVAKVTPSKERKRHAPITETIELSSSVEENRMVSPIKIVGQNVQRLVRQKITNEIIDIDEVSPSKRRKENNKDDRSKNSKSTRKDAVRKNLNSSFGTPNCLNDTNDDEMTGSDAFDAAYTSAVDEIGLKLKISKLHDQPNTPTTRSRRLTQVEFIRNEATPSSRRSILRTPNSNKYNTPKKSVVMAEELSTTIEIPGTPRTSKATKSRRASTIATPATPITPSSRPTRAAAATASAKNLALLQCLDDKELTSSKRKSTARATPMDVSTPKSTNRRASVLKTPSKTEMTPQMTRKLFRSGNLTPSIQARETAIDVDQTELQMVRERLHVSSVPTSLPCRKTEFDSIYTFVRDKIVDGSGGCVYISGVPGTGKTATVTQVIKKLQLETVKKYLPKFEYVDINGMRLTEPRQAYVQIYRQLTGKTVPWIQARELLEKRFTKTKGTKGKLITTILLIDELDILCNRKQDVVYNLFDWTTKGGSKLVAITIANTMDLPERVLKLKVASRLGLTRITFQPYTFKQLQEIVMARLGGSESFVSDAVQLVARKVASVSGDCRRALDICRRATEIAEEVTGNSNAIVKFGNVQQALEEMFASPKIRAIRNCSRMEKLFLQAVAAEVTRTGIEEVSFTQVYLQLQSLAALNGISKSPIMNQAMYISLNLGASRILIVEDSTIDMLQKIILNVSVDDLHFALNQQ